MKHKKSLSIRNLLVVIVFLSIFTMAVRIPFAPDTWWHLRSGQYIVENRIIPTTDPFSHTRAGELWIDDSWLAQIFWYMLFAMGGWAVVTLGVASLATFAFWFVWKQIDANVFVTAFVMILGAIVSSVAWTARPQMISFLLAAIFAYLLNRFKRHDGQLLPWIPLIMLLWVNVHGGFAIGFMLMVAYLVGEAVNNITAHQADPVVNWSRLRYLVVVMAISLAVVLINPQTWRMWFYPFQTVGISALRDFIQEWQSPNFHLPYVQPFALMLLLVVAGIARANRRADWTDLALVAMWTIWALFAARNIAIFGLIITPILARYTDIAWTRQWQTWGYSSAPFSNIPRVNPKSKIENLKSKINWVLLILVFIAAVIKIYIPLTPSVNLKAEQAALPYDAVEFIQDNRPVGPMFNSYNWGGYLIFKLWPEYPVYIDGRTDLYDDAFIRRYLDVMVANDGWQQTLEDDNINLVFIESNSILAKFLLQDPDWSEIYHDKMAIIFERKTLQP